MCVFFMKAFMCSSLFCLPFRAQCRQPFVLPAAQLNGDCVGLTCDLNTHRSQRLTTQATGSVLACELMRVCICRINTSPLFSFCLCLIISGPPQGTLRAVPVPMTTSLLLSITEAASYPFAYRVHGL